ncbi:universal stress protein [Hymenobacter sp. 15J16-1T3B]|uniref:universal stress protein n=1 Tax=Hymenobacter sp. 15J16-1T3B TaxID=2886941 RepID=UPI001D119724|nr:universal stress protein [Hymenobacter sp. 15J16-1T3B]MCC3159738.1 universal stress protein [Hymenobacter sp. 15J16-1T3B]
MKPVFVVLSNLSPEAHRAAYYAALLAAATGAELRLVHLKAEAVVEPEFGLLPMPVEYLDQQQLDAAAALAELARTLPVVASVEPAADGLHDTLQALIHRQAPHLLVLGLAPEHYLIDQLLYNYALPALRDTRLPLLLVPAEAAGGPGLPRQLALALDGAAFRLGSASRRLLALLQGLSADYTVVHVAGPAGPALDMRRVVATARQAGALLAAADPSSYQLQHASRSAGLVQAAVDIQADWLVLVARPRSLLASLWPCHLATAVARRCPVPVLLLPAEAEPAPALLPTAVDGLLY